MKQIGIGLLFVTGLCLLGYGTHTQSKAILAQWLIEYSWNTRPPQQAPRKPWWWADTQAVARLTIPAHHKSLFVMNSSSGQALAFGPGHMPPSAAPGKRGHTIIAGHRDSHFRFLADINIGDLIIAEHYLGDTVRYRVVELKIIDAQQQRIPLYHANLLTLVTCFPFDDLIPGGPLRLLVNAELETGQQSKPDKRAEPTII